jgi:hypothetical protein
VTILTFPIADYTENLINTHGKLFLLTHGKLSRVGKAKYLARSSV